MEERPILFTPSNAQKVFNEEKWQTRRVIKLKPDGAVISWNGLWKVITGDGITLVFDWERECPYGVVGDRLWVKEAWCAGKPHDGRSPTEIWERLKEIEKGVTVIYKGGGWKSVAPLKRIEPEYKADEPMPKWAGKIRNAMFMPRWASRSLLEITEVRVERLQDISGKDAFAEGISVPCYDEEISIKTLNELAVSGYKKLWDSINGKDYPWSSNPWTWAMGEQA